MITAHILPADMTHHEAAQLAVQLGLHFVISRRTGQSALVAEVKDDMVPMHSADKQPEAA